MRQAWRQAQRVAHDQIVKILEGKGGVVTTNAGEVAIDTRALATQVRGALDTNGIHLFDAIPTDALEGRFVLFRSTDLAHAQRATRILDETATWLPFLTVTIGGAAIAGATRRRRSGEILAVGIAAAMVLIAIGVAVGRAYYLARVGAPYRTIAAAPLDALVDPLRAGTRLLFVLALAAALILWLSGSTSALARERRVLELLVSRMHRYAGPLGLAGAGFAATLLVTWDKPRPFVVYTTIVALGLWEVACYLTARSHPRSDGPPGGPAPAAN